MQGKKEKRAQRQAVRFSIPPTVLSAEVTGLKRYLLFVSFYFIIGFFFSRRHRPTCRFKHTKVGGEGLGVRVPVKNVKSVHWGV